MKAVVFLLFAFLCACVTIPEDAEGFKKYAETSSFIKTEHFPIAKASLKDVEKRLHEYSERCLGRELSMLRCGTFNCAQGKPYRTYTPSVNHVGSKLRLTLMQTEAAKPLNGPQTFPILVAEAEQGKSVVQGHVYAGALGHGAMLEATKGWMTGENKTCPNL